MNRSALIAIGLFGSLLTSAVFGQTAFTVQMDGTQTTPPANTQASGSCIGTLNTDETEFTFTCTHDVQQVTDGHVHAGASGVSGSVVFTFSGEGASGVEETWSSSDADEPLTAILVQDLKAGNLYVNIHSEIFTVEEIRGQILSDDQDGSPSTGFQGLCGSLFGASLAGMFLGLCAMRFISIGRRISR
jgi:hypothetical protein